MAHWMDEARAEDLRRAGWSVSQVAEALGHSKAAVSAWCSGLDLPHGTSLRVVRDCQKIIDRYLDGAHLATIGQEVGKSIGYVQWVLQGARTRWPEIPNRAGGEWRGPVPAVCPRVRAVDVIGWRRSRR